MKGEGARGSANEEVRRLLARVERLELAARANAAGLAAGAYTTAVPGKGLLFHEARKYNAGESARRIDWNLTARLGEPYVRVHLDERRREVILAVDVSPSMHLGYSPSRPAAPPGAAGTASSGVKASGGKSSGGNTGGRTKLETAVEVAATLAVAAVDAGDRLGWVLFADQALEVERPRSGRRQLFRFLRSLLQHTAPWSRPVPHSDVRAALHGVGSLRGGPFTVWVLSDFVDHDVPDDLRYVRARHDVALLHVYDPLEHAEESGAGAPIFPGRAPEGPGDSLLAPSRPVRPGEGESLEEVRAFLRLQGGGRGMRTASFSTAEPTLPVLRRLLASPPGGRDRPVPTRTGPGRNVAQRKGR